MKRVAALMLVLVGCAMAGGGGAAERVPGAARVLPVVVERKTFDANTPNVPLTRGESGACAGNSRCEGSLDTVTLYKRRVAGGTDFEASVKVNSVVLTVGLNLVIWLPKNPPAWLTEHEEAHREIFARVYKGADKAALAAARAGSNKTYIGRGKTALLAERDAMVQAQQFVADHYNNAIPAVSARVNDLFDAITLHGLKSGPMARTPLSAKEAMEQAFVQYAKEAAEKSGGASAETRPAATAPESGTPGTGRRRVPKSVDE